MVVAPVMEAPVMEAPVMEAPVMEATTVEAAMVVGEGRRTGRDRNQRDNEFLDVHVLTFFPCDVHSLSRRPQDAVLTGRYRNVAILTTGAAWGPGLRTKTIEFPGGT